MQSTKVLRAFTLAACTLGPALGAAITSTEPAKAGEMAIVYVDIDHTIANVEEGKLAHESLGKEQQRRQKEISTREGELSRMRDELDKQAKSFSKDAIEKKAMQYQQALNDYQQVVIKFNKELGDKEREYYDPIERKLKEILRQIANRDGFDLILAKRSVPYGRPDLDLTDRIIQEYNRVYPATAKKGTPTTPASPTSAKPATPAPAASAH